VSGRANRQAREPLADEGAGCAATGVSRAPAIRTALDGGADGQGRLLAPQGRRRGALLVHEVEMLAYGLAAVVDTDDTADAT